MKKMLLFGAAMLIAASVSAVPEGSVNYPDLAPGAKPTSGYSFTQMGETLNTNGLPENIKRIIHRDGKLYILSDVATNPKISIFDAENLVFIKDMDITDISCSTEVGARAISDIGFTADGKLMACIKEWAAIASTARQFKVFIWDDDSAAPEVFYQTKTGTAPNSDNHTANWNNAWVGETMAVSGPSWDCTVFVSAVSHSGANEAGMRFIAITKEDDETTLYWYGEANKNAMYSELTWGPNYQFVASPLADNRFIVTSETSAGVLCAEFEFTKDWGTDKSWNTTQQVEAVQKPLQTIQTGTFAEKGGYELFKTNGINYFRYAGNSYMVAPVADAGRVKAGVVLFDITDGLDQAVKVSEKLPEAGLGTAAAPYMTAYGTVKGKDIILGVLAQNQGFAKFTTGEGGDGILKPQKLSGVQVSPNPVQDIVRINCDFAITSIKLIDLTGRVIMNIPANQTSFDMSGVAAGNYILLVNNTPVKVIKK